MRRHIPGLNFGQRDLGSAQDGLFLVRVEKAFYHWRPKKAFLELRFAIMEPKLLEARSFCGRLYCTKKALWKLNWFLRDFGYDIDLLSRDQVDEKALVNLRGIVRTSSTRINGNCYQNLDAFAPAGEWEALSYLSKSVADEAGGADGL